MKKLLSIVIILFSAVVAYGQATISATEKEATDLYKQGKATDAIALFKKSLAENPKSLYSINALGNLYYSTNQYQQAYTTADQGVQLSGGAVNFMIVKAKAGIMLNKAKESVAMIDQYIANHQPDFMLLFVKATAFNALGEMQQALNFFSQSIAANPEYPPAYLARGKDFATIERWPQAVQDYTKYITMMADDEEGYAVRGVVYYKTGKLDEALADYNKALQLEPKQQYALNNRGVVYKDRKQTDKAFADFNAAIAIDPGFADPYYQSAFLYSDLKDYAKALPLINKAIALQNIIPAYYAIQCRILLGVDKNTEAMVAANKILEIDPKSSDGFLYKTMTFYNMDKFDDALKTATEGIAVMPGNYLLYGLRASVYKAKGNNALANADDEKAKQLGAAIK
jgi:tetratricopeptide (TPR) repeat protein